MDTVSKGSKPVVYKTNMRLKFYTTAIEDCKVTVTHIFTKIMEDGNVAVFGEYVIFLLFSYFDNQKQKVYLTESQTMKFCESISCHLPAAVDGRLFDTHASFDPRVSCTRASSNAWNTDVEGEIDVFVYGDKDALNSRAAAEVPVLQTLPDGTTIVRLEDSGVAIDELLNMDMASIENLTSGSLTIADSDASIK